MAIYKLTDKFCASVKLPEGKVQVDYFDAVVRGMALRVGIRSRAFTLHHNAKRFTLGQYPNAISLAEARTKALEIKNGVAPRTTGPTLHYIIEAWLSGPGAKIRTLDQRRGVFERYIFPTLGLRPVGELKRSDIVAVLDRLPGDRTHDIVLSALNTVFTWHALRDENFINPLPKGLARGTAPRDRVLNDGELRAVWRACEDVGWYGHYCRLLTLTACRKAEIEDMARGELNLEEGELLIPASRYKTGVPHLVPLSKPALEIVAVVLAAGSGVERLWLNGVVKFTHHPQSKLKAASGVDGWTLHDLRRTARSLMSRAGVPSDHAERCLGHVIGGVRGVYDRHAYIAEKRAAFEMLAKEIEKVVAQ